MRSRHDITELFSSFMLFEADRFNRWVADRRLYRSMQKSITQPANHPNSEQFWALYWYRCWQKQAILPAELHLCAYLQEPCYWAAQKIAKNLTTSQDGLADYFQWAIAEVAILLKGFNPERSPNLRAYAHQAFINSLKDGLRQRREADFCTDWGLLRKTSKMRVAQVLQNMGLSAPEITRYQLALTCFKVLYVPTQQSPRRLMEPDRLLWQAIANLYQREQPSQPGSLGPPGTPENLRQWLLKLAAAVRTDCYPPVLSLNTLKRGSEGIEWQDELPEFKAEAIMAELIAAEDASARQTQRAQVCEVLTAALNRMDEQSQTIVQAYYERHLSQQQIADELTISQPTVARRLIKARDTLLAALMQWSSGELNNLPTPNLVKTMGAALEEWLQVRGHHFHAPEENEEI